MHRMPQRRAQRPLRLRDLPRAADRSRARPLIALAAAAIAACGSAQANPPPRGEGARVVRTFEGRASYYSDRLAGRSTASGEPYDPRALTAAHRDLPFGTRLRVTRVGTDRSVVVRVNDRGPFGNRGRVLDLSRAAAEALDMIRAGVVSVRAEVLER